MLDNKLDIKIALGLFVEVYFFHHLIIWSTIQKHVNYLILIWFSKNRNGRKFDILLLLFYQYTKHLKLIDVSISEFDINEEKYIINPH